VSDETLLAFSSYSWAVRRGMAGAGAPVVVSSGWAFASNVLVNCILKIIFFEIVNHNDWF